MYVIWTPEVDGKNRYVSISLSSVKSFDHVFVGFIANNSQLVIIPIERLCHLEPEGKREISVCPYFS